MQRTISVLGLVLALVATAAVGRAADEGEGAPAAPPSSKWHFEALPYAWLPGNYGTLNVKGNSVDISVTPVDAYQLFEDGNAYAAAGYFELGYDRFSVFDDAFGGYAEESVDERIPTPLCCSISVNARDKIKYVINDVALAYEIGQWSLPGRKRPFTLGVYAGARSMWFYNRLNATVGVVKGAQKPANVTDSFAWSDPMIGVRWSAPLLDFVSLDFRADIGGFGASSNLIWGISSAFKVWLPWHPLDLQPYLAAGYRAVDFDRSSGNDSLSLAFRGPTVGAGFVF